MIICLQDCEILNDTMMLCRTPNTKTASDSISRRKKREVGPLGEASFGFIIADVSDLLTWSEDNNVTMEYFPDPVYFPFEENPKVTKGGSIEQIEVRIYFVISQIGFVCNYSVSFINCDSYIIWYG